MSKKMTAVLSMLLLCFYGGIVLYVFFAILHIDALANFETAMAFQIIGFVCLIYFVHCGIYPGKIKTGFFVPLIVATVLYTCILDALNFTCVAQIKHIWFVLIHFITLFVYFMVSVPMYIMGRNK
ncbi:hypothetical protein [Clostridium sp.]